MNRRVLLVDDDTNLLASYRRQLHRFCDLETASSGREGLELLAAKGPFAVIVSDLRMPQMDGIEFLAQASQAAPETVRIMLTGYADLQNATQAINQGRIFRLLTKPCQSEDLEGALTDGMEQYRLVQAERELLEKTLGGAVSALAQILSMVNPEAFSRALRIKHYSMEIGRELAYPRMWELDTAASLSQVGCLTLPEEILTKLYKGIGLNRDEQLQFMKHPQVASELLGHIPRLEGVVRIIYLQGKRLDGSGFPTDEPVSGEEIPLGARILKAAQDFDQLETAGNPRSRCLDALASKPEWYDAAVVNALREVVRRESRYEILDSEAYKLRPGMILAEDVWSLTGRKLAPRGMELEESIIAHIKAFARSKGVKQPIKVVVPI